MHSSLRAAALAFAGTLALAASAVAQDVWIADYDEAVKLAKAENKDLFVDFTGSDWCGWCKKLNAEVFDHEEFLTAVKKNFVLVSLDFPRSQEAKDKVPNPKRNDELRDKYDVQGYPTILLLTVDGEVFGQTGYRAGGPASYVEHVAKLRTGKQQIAEAKRLIAEWNAASGDAKVALWDKLATAFEAMDEESVAASSLVEPVKSALEFDKDNATGRRRRAVSALLRFGAFDAALIAAGREYDPKNEAGLLELALKGQFRLVEDDTSAKDALAALDGFDAAFQWKDPTTNFDLHFFGAAWCAQSLNDVGRAKKYAAAAKAIGSADKQRLEYLEDMLTK